MAILSSGTPQAFWTTSTGAVVSGSSSFNFQFGFRPLILRIENLGAVGLWVRFGSTGVASTADYFIGTCTGLSLLHLALGREIGIDKVSLAATSTATSAYNVLAMG